MLKFILGWIGMCAGGYLLFMGGTCPVVGGGFLGLFGLCSFLDSIGVPLWAISNIIDAVVDILCCIDFSDIDFDGGE